MQIDFLDSYPYRKLAPDLQSLAAGSRRMDAAVAFVTRPGVALVRRYLKTHGQGTARLVASVRFPTDLRQLASLEDVDDLTGRESLFSARRDAVPVKTKTPDAVFAARPEGTPLSQPRAEDGE